MTNNSPARLTRQQATRFAALPMRNLGTEYPNSLAHFLNGPTDVQPPSRLHPVFYGSYDWHSAVHGWWLLVRCLRRYPDLPIADKALVLLAAHFTADGGAAEAAYMQQPGRGTWERPYGWGWLLALCAELHLWPQPEARRWRAALRPLEDHIAQAFPAYLAKLTYPIRAGTHFNTAFGLILALHYARICGKTTLAQTIESYARAKFLPDADYPAHYEPNGDDFLSGALTETLLMAMLLPADDFASWFARFLPAQPFTPAIVADRSDAKGVHLDGLNFSRAWCLRSIAAVLPDPQRPALLAMAESHEAASLPFLESGEYGGEHWLATFAALAVEGLT
ncbi:MAG: DUF2891 domain-containing protein [Ferrovibrio sp.]|uniref:DUF2891 domain-containing protein n=1 Tax=Ferrovibrio sp. TaxID=1917215 RepID=UPI00391AAB76